MKWRISRQSWQLLLLFVTSVIGACGCSRTATVTGKIAFQGRPVTYGSVVVISSDKTAKSGVIQPDGRYSVEEVTPGDVKIAVISPDPTKGKHHGTEAAAAAADARKIWFPLPQKYEDPEKSGLRFAVAPGGNEHDIELK